MFVTAQIVYVGQSAFANCYKLEKLFLGNGITFEKQAFENCNIYNICFIGNAIFATDTFENLVKTEAKIYCNKNSNISEVSYYGASVQFY